MGRAGQRPAGRLVAAATIAIGVWAVGAVLAPGVATAQDDGVVERGATTWIVDPDAGVATARVALTITNTTPTVDGVVTWWERWRLALPSVPDAITVSTGEQTVDHVSTTTDDGTPAVRWDFPERLHHEDTQSWLVELEFRTAPPRSDFADGPRINPGFVAVPVWAWGTDHATLQVRVPARLDARLGGDPAPARDGGVDVWEATVDGRHAEILLGAAPRHDHVAEVVTVDGTEVTVLTWPDDPEWGEQVAAFAARALPELAAWTGTDWGGDELVIRETATPFVEGWGGWNDVGADTISVGEELDRAVWTHELAHNWFGPDEFSETWLAEGFSETATTMLADRLGVTDPPVPDPPDHLLADWDQVVAASERTRLEDPAGWRDTTGDLYQGAHHVVATVAEELGPDAFRRLVRMTLAEESTWAGPGEITVPGAADWREFLVLAEHLGSTRARELLLEHVVPNAAELLRRRDRVVAAHTRLADHEWATPLGIRQALQYWHLDEAESSIREAFALRDRLERQAARAADLGAGWPDLRTQWETGPPAALTRELDVLTDLLDEIDALVDHASDAGVPVPPHGVDLATDTPDAVRQRLSDLRAATARVTGARTRVADARTDGVARVGLVGSDPDRLLEDATAALAAGNVDAALVATTDVTTMLDDAPGRGRSRIAGAVLATVLVGAGSALLVRLVRRRATAT